MYDNLGRMWNKAAMACFVVVSKHFPEGMKANKKYVSQDNGPPSRDLNQRSPYMKHCDIWCEFNG